MKKRKGNFRTADVLSISGAHLLHDIFGSFLSPIRPLLIDKLGISLSMAALLDIFQRIPSILNPVIGIIAEHRSLKYFVILAPAITSICMSLLGVFSSYLVICMLLLTAGLSSAFFHVPSPVMIKKASGDFTGRGMSFYMLGGELARTLGPLLITAAISLWGLEGTWRLMPFGITASVILHFRFKRLEVSHFVSKQKFGAGIWKVFRKFLPFFAALATYIFFRAILKSGLTAFLPTLLFNEEGHSLWMSNISLALLQLAGAAGTLLSGTLSDRIGRKTLLLIVAIFTPVLTWVFILSEGFFSWVALALLGLFLFAPGPVLLALVQDTESKKPAFMNGIFMTISFVIGSIAVIFSGIIADFMGLENTFKLSAIIALLAIPAVYLIPDVKKKQK